MNFDHIFNLQTCYDFVTNVAPMQLVYYSHFISIASSLILSTIILVYGRKDVVRKILFVLSLSFSAWVTLDLIIWTTFNSVTMMLAWSFLSLLTSLIYILAAYFGYSFIYNKDIPFNIKLFFFVLLAPVILWTSTIHNLSGFLDTDCISIESPLLTNYSYSLGIVSFLFVLFVGFRKYFITTDKLLKRQILLIMLGVNFFIVSFFVPTVLDTYLVASGVTGDYMLGNYGLFGIVALMALITFMIVRFKAFNIKLLGAQALMWVIGLLVGSQLFFIKTTTNFILTSITLVITVVAGYILVRSVKKVDEQREQLEIANKNQMLLVRFISHQVKGFFTKSKAVFAGFLEGDYGQITDDAKCIVTQALESDSQAVNMVTDVLNAASLKNGSMKFEFVKTDICELVKPLAEEYRKIAEANGLKYTVEIPEEKLLANIDKTQFTQVIKNLIDNAVKYTPRGFVKVSLSKHLHDSEHITNNVDARLKNNSGIVIVFEVSDSGVGLTEDDKRKLFTEGGRGEESVKVNVTSTGYGLYIVKKIVDTHNGYIYATSEGRDKGSDFRVELPYIGEE